MMETEFDLKDYSLELSFRETQETLEDISSEESALHPLGRISQPYDWCQVLQLTS